MGGIRDLDALPSSSTRSSSPLYSSQLSSEEEVRLSLSFDPEQDLAVISSTGDDSVGDSDPETTTEGGAEEVEPEEDPAEWRDSM